MPVNVLYQTHQNYIYLFVKLKINSKCYLYLDINTECILYTKVKWNSFYNWNLCNDIYLGRENEIRTFPDPARGRPSGDVRFESLKPDWKSESKWIFVDPRRYWEKQKKSKNDGNISGRQMSLNKLLSQLSLAHFKN